MTKLRQPNSIEDALLEMYAILGIDNAGAKIARTPAHMRRLSDPDHTSLPTIQQCMVLDAECVRAGHVPPMLELYSRWIASIAHEEGADEGALGDLFIEIASGIPVIALSQLSRAVEQRDEKRPQLADLRESGSIEQDADIVMFVYRDEYYLQRAEPRPDSPAHAAWQERMEQAANLAELIIAKHRNGPIANVTLGFEPHATKFSDHVQDRHLEAQYSLGGES